MKTLDLLSGSKQGLRRNMALQSCILVKERGLRVENISWERKVVFWQIVIHFFSF